MQETSIQPANHESDQPPRLLFPKSSRLLKHGDFERVYRQGRRFSLPDMAVFYLRRVEAGGDASSLGAVRKQAVSGFRVGFTVPRALGGAVQRNRIKRRMREAVRLSWSLVRNYHAADVVINPRRSVAEIDFERLLSQVQEALQAIHCGRGAIRKPSSDAGMARAKARLNSRAKTRAKK